MAPRQQSRTRRPRPERETYTTSTGNVFADLELPDAGLRLVHAELTRVVARVERRRSDRRDPRSIEDLIRALDRRGYDVRITLQRRARPRTVAL